MNQSRSSHLVDRQLLALAGSVPTDDLDITVLRTMRDAPMRFTATAEDIARTELVVHKIPGRNGSPDIEIRIYRPRNSSKVLPCIFHVHGGGFVLGAASREEAHHRPLVAELDCCLASVEYRLAPETRFPGALQDCYAALSWVITHSAELRIDPARLGVMGESAGGGLAACLALLVRDIGEYRFTFQHLIYPMLDDRTCVTSEPHPYSGEFVWTSQRNHFGWSSLLGFAPGSEGLSHYAAAARAENLTGLPPAFIAVGALDLFLDENLEYARRLIRCGVPVELHVYPGAFHGFQWERDADITKMADRDTYSALARGLRQSST